MSTTHIRNPESNRRSGVSLLSLDAGGPRGISQLQILKHIMNSIARNEEGSTQGIAKKPCEVFAAIGGTGTGGMISILLAVLEMTVDEALEEFTSFATKVFKDVEADPKKQTDRLKQAINDLLEKRGVAKTAKLIAPNGTPPSCRLFVPIMYKNNAGITVVLNNHVDSQGPPMDLTIYEAMLATCATPPLFSSTKLSQDFSSIEYTGADLGLSNPVREIIAGAHRAFGDETAVPCLISIGCGHPGVNITPSATDKSSRIAFLERLSTDGERVAQDIARQMKKLGLYHRLSVPYGLEASHPGYWKDPEEIVTHTTSYLNDQEVADEIAQWVDTLRDGVGFTTLEQLNHSGGEDVLPPEMLQLTPNYVDRRVPMEFIEKAVFKDDGSIKAGSKRIIVTGMGGCGKTQLVRKFIEEYGERFSSVFFIDGTSIASIKHDVLRYVRSLGGAHSQKSFEESMRFLSLPSQDGQRLMVIDNVDDPKVPLSNFLPRWKSGNVIITSRNASHRQLGPTSHLQLDVMTPEESVELLSGSADIEGASTIAAELGFLPIALVQAASYMLSTECSAETYISRLHSSRERMLNDPATSQIDMRYKTAFAAFDASYNILPSDAQKTLQLLSFFNRQMFPFECIEFGAKDDFSGERTQYPGRGDDFERGRDCLKEIFRPADEWNPMALDHILRSLRNHSLVTIFSVNGMRLLSMHPLVHEWSQMLLVKDDMQRFQAAAVRLLSCAAQDNNLLMLQYLYPHLQALSSVWGELHVNDAHSFGWILHKSGIQSDASKLWEQVKAALVNQLGSDHIDTVQASASLAMAYHQLGRYDDAKELGEQVVNQRTRMLGVDHLDTILASANLAVVYRHLGRYDDAKNLGEQVVKQRTRLLGVDHPDTIFASANLAVVYQHLGRYGDAKNLEEKVLKQRTRLLGVDHPETILSSGNLAAVYRSLGLYDDAKGLEEQVLKHRTRLLGVDHPDTIVTSANLAVSYQQLGRYGDAKELGEKVLTQRTRLMGVDHPETIRSSANLAVLYCQLGRYGDAKALEEQVLEQRTRLLGVDHPDTIMTSSNLAMSYQQLGRYSDAKKLVEQVLEQRTRLLGFDHPETIQSSGNLASVYRSLGRYEEAKELDEQVLKQRTRLLGVDHPETIQSSGNLAVVYNQLGRYGDAKELGEKVLEQRTRLLGVDHPDTIMASANLAVAYGNLERYDDARELGEQVLEHRTRLLGVDHPETIRSSANLAVFYQELGRYEDAKELGEKVLEQRMRLLGVDHPDTIIASANLAVIYSRLGRYGDAKDQGEQVLNQRTRLLGVDHPSTIIASANLAVTYYYLKRYEDARKLEEQVLEQRTRLLGVDHPDTILASESLEDTYRALRRDKGTREEILAVGN